MLTVGITGGTGFIGRHICRLLLHKGYKVIVFTRHSQRKSSKEGLTYALWNADKKQCDIDAISRVQAMIHLAGEGIADKRLTAQRKQEILDSRVKGTRYIVEQLKLHAPLCSVFIAASAIGYYGADKGGQPFTEDMPHAAGFLADTCFAWENESQKAASFLRTAIIRVGIVLGKEHGAFPEFVKPLRFGIMPILGGGHQVVSWIHIADLAGIFVHAIEHDNLSGPYNGVAPHPVTNKELMRAIATAKGGIRVPVPVPAFLLKVALGELSEEVLKSTTVSAKKIEDSGYHFTYPHILPAVTQIIKA